LQALGGVAPVLGTAAADRVGELTLAAATVVAIAALFVTLPALTRKKATRTRLTPALVIATGGAGITFVAYVAFQLRCSDLGCGLEPGDAIDGVYPWWRVEASWQWGAQLALASVGLMAGALALALAARQRRAARRVLRLARIAYFVWVLLAFVVPAAWELFVI
jgi:hypothetical protein